MKQKKKDNFYYFMRDILSCFPDNFGGNFIGIANSHLIAKETTRQILADEVKQKKPNFRILAGGLILQNAFLRQLSRAAIYEVIEVVPELKYCYLNDPRKTIKKLAAQTMLRLFVTLYFEYVIMPGRKEEGKVYINKFKEYFSENNITDAMNMDGVFANFIFEQHGIELSFGEEANKRLGEMLSKFYNKK